MRKYIVHVRVCVCVCAMHIHARLFLHQPDIHGDEGFARARPALRTKDLSIPTMGNSTDLAELQR